MVIAGRTDRRGLGAAVHAAAAGVGGIAVGAARRRLLIVSRAGRVLAGAGGRIVPRRVRAAAMAAGIGGGAGVLVGILVAHARAVAGPVRRIAGVAIGDPGIGLPPRRAGDQGERPAGG